MRGSFGGGLRVIGGYGFIGRVEVSRSEGETVFRLSGLQTFQFAGGGFYNGKKPVPFR